VKSATEEWNCVTQIYLVNYFPKKLLRDKFLNTVESTNYWKFLYIGKRKYTSLDKMSSVKKN